MPGSKLIDDLARLGAIRLARAHLLQNGVKFVDGVNVAATSFTLLNFADPFELL
jgi:hypothetical protein